MTRAMRSIIMHPSVPILTFLVLQLGSIFVNADPSPVSLNFGTNFFGSDGLWSAAQIRVGTPEQYLWVYPGTVASETWVIGRAGCDATMECQQARGGYFYENKSSTYQHLGLFDLTYNRLGLKTNYGDYGLDNVSVSDTVSVPGQVISTINATENWLGQLGLGVQHPQFEDKVNRLSFIASLVQNQSVIPSYSYGYTAGAYYKGKHLPGSLVLGGVDVTRFTPNNASFTLSAGYLPVVAVTSITVGSSQSQGQTTLPSGWDANPKVLLGSGQGALFTIDTSTPFLWMPPAVCDAFASALNLTYNSDLQLYTFPNYSSPQSLKDLNLTFTFTISNSVGASTGQVEIPISYDAFNLQLTYGFPTLNITSNSPGVNYFPLRKANSSDQYTIGRAFLQESYLKVEYESNSFSLCPALFPDTNASPPMISAIPKPAGSTWPGPVTSSNTSLSSGAKAGIGIGVALIVLTVLGLGYFLIHRRNKSHPSDEKRAGRKWRFMGLSKKSGSSTAPVAELVADRRHPRELLVDSSNTRFELPGQPPVEMAAGEVSEAYLASNQGPDGTIIMPRNGAELGLSNHSSVRKDYNIRTTVTERSESPAPPYSPSEVGRNANNPHSSSDGINSFNSGLSPGVGSFPSSSGVSPITGHGTQSPQATSSPVSPEMQASQTMSSADISSGTQSSGERTSLVVPSNVVSRSASHGGRFREVLDDQDHNEVHPPLRQRFSWEQ